MFSKTLILTTFVTLRIHIMKFNYLILLLVAITLSVFSYGQTNKYDSRLLVQFSEQDLNEMSDNDLRFHTYCIESAFEIGPKPVDSKSEFSSIPTISIDIENPINFFDLNIEITEKYQYYKIENSDKILMVKPLEQIQNELK